MVGGMAKESWCITMEESMKANGILIQSTARDFKSTPAEQPMTAVS